MNITLINDAERWRNALVRFGRHECYHTWDFHRIDTHSSDTDFFALEVTTGESALFVPVVSHKIPYSDLYDLSSVYGYPGPLHVGASEQFPVMLDVAFSRLRDMGFVSFFSRCSAFTMSHMAPPPECYFRSGKVVAIDLAGPADKQWRQYRDNLRREISRAIEGGLQCQLACKNELPSFLDLYHKTMNRVAAHSYYYFDQTYLANMLASDDFDCRLFVCKYENKIISAALFLFCNGIVQYHLSGSDETYSKLGATKLLIDYVRRLAAQEGFLILSLGGGLGGRADHLYNFKRGFTKNEEDFYLVKKVLNPVAYKSLLAVQNRNPADTSDFFPAYRQLAPGPEATNRTV